MTTFQTVSLAILAIVGFVQFVLPQLRLPVKKPNTLKQIESVIAIKDSSSDPKVIEACKQLLQTLI